MAAEEGNSKRSPELLKEEDQKEGEAVDQKRFPEFSSREEEAIGCDFLTKSLASNKEKEKKEEYNSLKELHQGTPLLRYTHKSGRPHFRYVQLAKSNKYLRWFSSKKNKAQSSVEIGKIIEVLQGQQTDVFQRSKQPQLDVASFSIVYKDSNNKKITLDLVAKGTDEATLWRETLQELMKLSQHKQGGDIGLENVKKVETTVQFSDRYRMSTRDLNTKGNSKIPASIITKLMKETKIAETKLTKADNKIKSGKLEGHPMYGNTPEVFQELIDRKGTVLNDLNNSYNTKVSRSDVWRLNVDVDCLLEKVEVLEREV